MPHLFLLLALALASSPATAAPRALKLRFPRTVIEPGRNVERCVFLRVPAAEAFDLASWSLAQTGVGGDVATAHFLVYLYTGERAGEFPVRQVVESRGCLDLGPADRDARQLVVSSAAPRARGALPAGLALPLVPTPSEPDAAPDAIGILLDVNWVNGSTRSRAVSARVVLHRARPGTVRRRLAPIADRAATGGIAVPPFRVAFSEGRWRPPGDVCLYDVTGQMHRRGRFFAVTARDAADVPRPPLDGPRDVFSRVQTLFGASDYSDPGSRRFAPRGLPLGAGESLHYGCWTENGDRLPMRLGCEETVGLTPGAPGAPAAPCRSGCTCVPANAVAGPTPDDELCGLGGFYYQAGPGGSCDLASAAAIP